MNIRIEELFHELADLSADERARYFVERDVDQDTRREVEALLACDSGTSAFLLRDISNAASRALPQIEPEGWRCGPYRLLDVIGRGGMGSVYLAIVPCRDSMDKRSSVRPFLDQVYSDA